MRASITVRAWPRARFILTWGLAVALLGIGIPRTVDVSWHGVLPVLTSLNLSALIGLTLIWAAGLWVHSFVLVAAAPSLTHRRALTLNVTGSAVANVVPLGGVAGVALNQRMMRAWGVNAPSFLGYTFLTNLWDVLAKLALPAVAIIVLDNAGETVTGRLQLAALLGLGAFVVVLAFGTAVLFSLRVTMLVGRTVERVLNTVLTLLRLHRRVELTSHLVTLRRECTDLVAAGWIRMSLAMAAYVSMQWLLLWWCLHLSGAGVTVPEVLAGFAVERILTVLPLTPGGLGVADLGLAGVLLTLGGDPTGVAAGVVLYRIFVFAVEIPVGGGTLGLWLLGRRLAARRNARPARRIGEPRRIAHVTDVFLPRLGGIETHVDDLVRHQRERGLDAVVLTPTSESDDDPLWVHRVPLRDARRIVGEYDVVHVHLSMFSVYGLGVARAAMAQGVPTLLTVHSMWAGLGTLVRLASLAALRRWPVAWSAVSNAAAETFRQSLGGIDVAVLANALDVDEWAPTMPARERAAPVTLISVMRLMPRKRPLHLLRLVRRANELLGTRDLRLVIVGDGPLQPRLLRYVKRHDMTDTVRLTGRIPRSAIRAELAAADVYIAPAPKESFGIAALEARCAGLPVIASRRSGVGEFIRDRVDGLLVDSDAQMAVAIAELVTDNELRHRITSHNHRVRPLHDWTSLLDRTNELYRVAGARAVALDPEPQLALAR